MFSSTSTDELYTNGVKILSPMFKGVFPRDGLPKRGFRSHPWGVIVNHDPSHLPGVHWVAIYRKAFGLPVEYFDSFGLQLERSDPLITWIYTLADECLMPNFAAQNFFTETCGPWALYFLHWRDNDSKSPFESFLKDFVDSSVENDRFISTWYNSVKYIS